MDCKAKSAEAYTGYDDMFNSGLVATMRRPVRPKKVVASTSEMRVSTDYSKSGIGIATLTSSGAAVDTRASEYMSPRRTPVRRSAKSRFQGFY